MSKEKNDFKPFIPTDKVMPEFTPTALILGIILAVVFGAANAYLGLRAVSYTHLDVYKRQGQ